MLYKFLSILKNKLRLLQLKIFHTIILKKGKIFMRQKSDGLKNFLNKEKKRV